MANTAYREMLGDLTGRPLPYRVELDGETVIAVCGTPNVAYAAYYASLREYHGRSLSLLHGDRLLVASEARRSRA